MPFLNGNAGAFNSNVKLLKLHNSILWFEHAYAFCSYQNVGNAINN